MFSLLAFQPSLVCTLETNFLQMKLRQLGEFQGKVKEWEEKREDRTSRLVE